MTGWNRKSIARLTAVATCCLAFGAPAGAAPPSEQTIHPSLERLLAEGLAANAWVFLRDKGVEDLPAALAALEETYHPKAIARRRLRRTAPGLFDARDLPVHEGYVLAIVRTGATVRTRSRWLNAVSVRADADQLERIGTLPFVTKLQPVRTLRTPPPVSMQDRGGIGAGAGGFYGQAEAQLAQIALIDLHNAGYTGEGVLFGVLDTGFRRTHVTFNYIAHPLDVAAEWDFVDNDPNTAPDPGDPPTQHEHGTLILGTIGAYLPFGLVGGAYDASFILAKVEDVTGEYFAEEDMFVAGLEFIEAEGGDVATSSVVIFDHYTQEQLDGLTSVMTIGFNAATDNGVHCFQGAGNEGHDNDPGTSHLLPPADAFDVVSVGAVDSAGVITWFSSDGPTADGRVKPEVLTRGLNTWTVHPHNDNALTTASGTSLATPLAAAMAACLVEAHPEWTVTRMRTAIFQVCNDYRANCAWDPLYVRGYGLADALAALEADPDLPDCNDNAVFDDCDIANGTSDDRNRNGIPDECEQLGLPFNFRVTFGVHRAGTVESLHDSDDDRLEIEQRAALTPLLPPVRVAIDAIVYIWPPSSLTVRYEASCTARPFLPPQRLSLYDFVAGEFVTIDERLATADDTVVEVTITDDPGRFVTPGSSISVLQAEYFNPGAVFSPAWRARIDQAIWTVEL